MANLDEIHILLPPTDQRVSIADASTAMRKAFSILRGDPRGRVEADFLEDNLGEVLVSLEPLGLEDTISELGRFLDLMQATDDAAKRFVARNGKPSRR